MICTHTNAPAKHCTGPASASWYNGGCRCDAVMELKRRYWRRYKGALGEQTACPMCGRMTKSESGFCRFCE
ncbi:MAG: hypothetical protein IJ131_09760 [Eggerthellaceae bacterium]|nr:hypothetical protein [Eggerthellaceae bacterium]